MRTFTGIVGTCLLAYSLFAGGDEIEKESQKSSRFAVAIDANGDFEIEDLHLGEKTAVERKAGRGSGQWMHNRHWLEYQEGPEGSRTTCLFDLENRVRYCDSFLNREPGEAPWSPGGTYLVWRSRDQTKLHVARAEEVNLVAGEGMPPAALTIQGDPVGLIWQQRWLTEDRLLIGTGSGESVCFGALDLAVEAFYFLECCGTPLCSNEEFREARSESETWLSKRGFLDNTRQWKVADPGKFPWFESP